LTCSFETPLLQFKLAEVSLSKLGQMVPYGLTSHSLSSFLLVERGVISSQRGASCVLPFEDKIV
jgi:hypothetical protein